WAELKAVGPAGVARDDAARVGRFDVAIEGISWGHVSEGGGGRVCQLPAAGEHDYLAWLGAGDGAAGVELKAATAAGIAADHAIAVGRLHERVKRVGGGNIPEAG